MANKRKRRHQELPVLHPDAAGIDIGASELFVAVAANRDPNQQRILTTASSVRSPRGIPSGALTVTATRRKNSFKLSPRFASVDDGAGRWNNVRDAITVVARAASFHPIRDYLKSPKWDGRPRLKTLFQDYFGTKIRTAGAGS
jgi:hypothetical protein